MKRDALIKLVFNDSVKLGVEVGRLELGRPGGTSGWYFLGRGAGRIVMVIRLFLATGGAMSVIQIGGDTNTRWNTWRNRRGGCVCSWSLAGGRGSGVLSISRGRGAGVEAP